MCTTDPAAARLWRLGGSLAMGTGIWAMHFVGMLAYRLPLLLGYRAVPTIASWLAAMAASYVALSVASRTLDARRMVIGSATMGAGICAMHYIGMAAIDVQPGIAWNRALVAASVAIAVLAAAAALLTLTLLHKRCGAHSLAWQGAAATVMGLGIVGMHYTGMAAAGFAAGSVCWSVDEISGGGLGMAIGVSCGALLIGVDVFMHSCTKQLARSLQLRNADLRMARDAAEAANRAKSAFLANMSHEIHTPMNAIIGLTHVVLGMDLGARQRELLAKVQASSNAMRVILDDVLDYAKVEAGRLTLEQSPFALETCLNHVANLFGVEAENKGLAMTFDVAPDAPRELVGDIARLTQVLTNLVGNAIKFTHHGGVRVRVGVAALHTGGCTLRFSIEDTGIGISQDQAALLFQPFIQADGSITRKFGGTGLGLTISQRLVELMGGQVTVSSAPGAGCIFNFTVRLLCNPVPPAPPAQPAAANPERPMFTGRILLAEDNLINQEVAMAILRAHGVTPRIANDGLEAVSMVEREPFDLVLMDLHMPVMGGLEATRRIKEMAHAKDLPVVAMTAAVMIEDLEQCREAGMVDFVPKPVDPAVLAQVLRRWLAPAAAVNSST